MDFCVNRAFFTMTAERSASKGLRVEGIDVIPQGWFLYRLLKEETIPDSICMRGNWWFQESVIRKILLSARDSRHHGGTSINIAAEDQARESAALSRTWAMSGSGCLVVAKVINPTGLYWGSPRPIGFISGESTASGLQKDGRMNHESEEVLDIDALEIVPDPRCVQFYLPGMKTVGRKCLSVQKKLTFSQSAELAEGEIELFLRQAKL